MTEAAADLEVSACAVALTLTAAVGKAAGAVYSPNESTLPTVELPPGVPFTSHETWVLEAPLTVAANRWVADVSREAELGLILIDTGRGTGGGGLPPAFPPPQANMNAIGMIKKTIAYHMPAFLLEGFHSKPASKIPVTPSEIGMTNRC